MYPVFDSYYVSTSFHSVSKFPWILFILFFSPLDMFVGMVLAFNNQNSIFRISNEIDAPANAICTTKNGYLKHVKLHLWPICRNSTFFFSLVLEKRNSFWFIIFITLFMDDSRFHQFISILLYVFFYCVHWWSVRLCFCYINEYRNEIRYFVIIFRILMLIPFVCPISLEQSCLSFDFFLVFFFGLCSFFR